MMHKKINFLYILVIFLSSCISSASYLESRYINIGDKLLPSVVEVVSVGLENVDSDNWKDFFQDQEDLQSDKLNTGVGSGVIIESQDDDYYIITNKHVVGELAKVTIILYDNSIIVGDVIGFDARFDIAVVKIKSEKPLKIARLYRGRNLKVGQFVAAIGSPMSYVQSMSIGIISNLGRFGGPKDNLSNYIQTDAAINHGNSGGPLVNINGEVIGINTWLSSPTSGNVGLGFAMPIENIYPSFRSIVDNGGVKIGWVGVSSYGFPQGDYYSQYKGAFLNQVVIDSPAYISGIRAGDIIISINNKVINSPEEMFLQISLLQPQAKANIVIIRDGSIIEINLILSESSENVLETSKKVFPGFILGQRDDKIIILQVLPKSIGLLSGFIQNDIINSVNGRIITDITQFYSSIIKGENSIIISRDGNELELKLIY
ncbi:MAG: trypsin-like peptidase domain-containing protein [Spirochaetales bacterium]|nr:trypsin-like peptidase domain-containing protein [Spirochaetales bacterium]